MLGQVIDRPAMQLAPAAARRAAVLGVAVSVVLWLVALEPWHWYMGDLVVYRGGGGALLHGEPLYSVVSGRNHLHFTYPPIASVPAAALEVMPLAMAKTVVATASAAALVASISIYARQLATETDPLPALLVPAVIAGGIWLEPVRATFSFGQINILLMALVVVDLLWMRNRRSAGLLVGLATAIKLTPGAFIVYLLVSGRIRPARNAVASFVCLTALGAAVEPSASRVYWLDGHVFDAHRIGRAENASNQSIRGVLARLLHNPDVPAWWLVLAGLVLAAGCFLAAIADRRGRESQAVVVVGVAMLCASPISWSHHWVWCALMPIACFDLARRSRGVGTLISATAVLVPFAAGLVFWAPHTDHRELGDTALQQTASASYVLAGLLLCALIGRDIMRNRTQLALEHLA